MLLEISLQWIIMNTCQFVYQMCTNIVHAFILYKYTHVYIYLVRRCIVFLYGNPWNTKYLKNKSFINKYVVYSNIYEFWILKVLLIFKCCFKCNWKLLTYVDIICIYVVWICVIKDNSWMVIYRKRKIYIICELIKQWSNEKQTNTYMEMWF